MHSRNLPIKRNTELTVLYSFPICAVRKNYHTRWPKAMYMHYFITLEIKVQKGSYWTKIKNESCSFSGSSRENLFPYLFNLLEATCIPSHGIFTFKISSTISPNIILMSSDSDLPLVIITLDLLR